jgi:hypothetical protein
VNARTYRGLLIANSTFPGDPHNLPNLEGPRNDAALLRDALCDREYGLFAADNVRLVQERAMSDVLREIEDFLRSASRQDTLLLYYSGHGVLDQSNEFFLCAHNTRSDRLRSTAVKASDVREMIDESAAQTTLIFLDCCHSGRFKGGDVPATLEGQGRFVVTSSRSGELANDAHALNHASLFTHHLVEGLRGKAVDHDYDGVVNLSELYDYVHDALGREGKQVPQKRFEGSGEIPIALRPAAIEEPAPAGLVAPAATMPVLDVSDTVIDLGEIGADETLPPERILVINRGGGTLDWTVQSSADWAEALPGETGVELRLHPAVGPNRANIYITDTKTGLLKTVRVRVRVRPAAAPSPSGEVAVTPAAPPPEPAAPAPEPAAAASTASAAAASTAPAPAPVEPAAPVAAAAAAARPESAPQAPTPVPAPPVDVGAASLDPPLAPTRPPEREDAAARPVTPRVPKRGRWTIAAALAGAAAGLITFVSGFAVADDVGAADSGYDIVLRYWWGPGLINTILMGAALAVSSIVAAVPTWRAGALACGAAIAFPLAFLRWADVQRVDAEWSWVGTSSLAWFRLSVFACLGAAVVMCIALARSGARLRRRRPAKAIAVVAVALVSVWGVSLAFDLFEHSDLGRFGDALGVKGVGEGALFLAVLSLVVAVMLAAAFLDASAAVGALVGVAIVPLAAVIGDVVFLADWEGDLPKADLFPVAFFAALGLVGVAITAMVRAGRTADQPITSG